MHGYHNIIPHTLTHEEWCTQMELARSFFWRELDTRKGKGKEKRKEKKRKHESYSVTTSCEIIQIHHPVPRARCTLRNMSKGQM